MNFHSSINSSWTNPMLFVELGRYVLHHGMSHAR
jgi:hypothetical protein